MSELRTRPPGRNVLLYDGHCRFCQAGARRIVALARPGHIDMVNFQEAGALDRFPGLSHDMCMQQMYLITPNGRAIGGFEAAVVAVATRRWIGWIAYLYYTPGLRWLFDRLYVFIARNRYRIIGKAADCPGGTCSLHLGKHGKMS